MEQTALTERWQMLQWRGLAVGATAIALSLPVAWLQPRAWFQSYLMAYVFWLGMALACLSLAMLYQLVGGSWGFVTRRLFEAGAGTLPLLAVLFLPIVYGAQQLYDWSWLTPPPFFREPLQALQLEGLYRWFYPLTATGSALHQKQSPYLNLPFWILRAVFYFGVWNLLAWCVNRWSLSRGEDWSGPVARRLRKVSGGGMVLVGLTFSFAVIDWLMSLHSDWNSSIYALIIVSGAALAALSLTVVILILVTRETPIRAMIPAGVFHDLGNLMLALLMLWAYMSFSQFLIIWSGDKAEESTWYVHRLDSPWVGIGLALVVFHFAVPFLLLLGRDIKRSPNQLIYVASGLVLMHVCDLYWIIAPEFSWHTLRLQWADPTLGLGLGGLWLAQFGRNMRGMPFAAEIERANRKEHHD